MMNGSTEAEQGAVLRVIKQHEPFAVSRRFLAVSAGVSDRIMRDAITQLIIERDEPIVSLNSGGYKYTNDREELLDSARRMRSQASEMSIRANALERIAEKL